MKNIIPSIVIYGSITLAILYEWTRPLLVKGWIIIGILSTLYIVYKIVRPVSVEQLHKEMVDKDNRAWSGDLETHRRRREARESVHRRQKLAENSMAGVLKDKIAQQEKRGIDAFPSRGENEDT